MGDLGGSATKWIDAVNQAEADKRLVAWLKSCGIINRRYREERTTQSAVLAYTRRYAILWANEQTLAPAIYGKTPTAVVSRRFKDEDPIGRMASEVLERACNYSLDEGAFDAVMKSSVKDYLLAARGTSWLRYVPTYGPLKIPLQVTGESYTDDSGEAYEDDDVETDDDGPYTMGQQVIYEEVCEDHVAYDDFLNAPVREWPENPWVARKVAMTREAMEKRKFKHWESVPLDWKPSDGSRSEGGKKACIYELWDKGSKKAYWFSKGYGELLDERDDPLGLTEFFPCPAPLYATQDLDSLVPIPDYKYYQDQAEELDELTARIGKLTDALRMVGFYSGENKEELARVFDPGNENKLIPVEGWAEFKEGGGARGIIEWIPIDLVAATLTACFETRKQIIDDIYQITGISDIMRGETDPDETATAQGLKANFGSLRVRDRQKAVARYAADIIRIKGEIIANKFSPDTLKAMTNVKMFDTPEQKALAQQQIALQQQAAQAQQQPPAPGQPPAPQPAAMAPVPQEVQEMLGRPTWQEVDGLLKNAPMRQFRIEIESDSTIEPNDLEQKQARVEFMTAVGTYLSNSLPVVQAAPQMLPVIMEGLKWLVRGFRVGREMEEVIDRASEQLAKAAQNPQPQGDPADAAKAQAAQEANAIKAQQVQLTAQAEQTKAQLAASQQQVEAQRSASEVQIAQMKADNDRMNTMLEAQRVAQEGELGHRQIDVAEIAAKRPAPSGAK